MVYNGDMDTYIGTPEDDGDDTPVDDSDYPANYLQDGDLIPRPDAKQWKPSIADPFPTFRCTKTKKNGERCNNQGITGMLPDNAKCVAHGGKQLSVKEKAKARVDAVRMQLIQDTGLAVEVLESLMQPGTADNIRLKAATEVLDRAGVRGGVEIDVSGEIEVNAAEQVRERIAKLALGKIVPTDEEDIIEGEVEDDDEEFEDEDA